MDDEKPSTYMESQFCSNREAGSTDNPTQESGQQESQQQGTVSDELSDLIAPLHISGQITEVKASNTTERLRDRTAARRTSEPKEDLYTALRKMREYDLAIELGTKTVVSLDESLNLSRVVLYDLETSGFDRRHDDILQVAAVRMDVPTDTFNNFVQPTKAIPKAASNVNGLFFENNKLFRWKPDGTKEFLPTVPSSTALNSFVEWAFSTNGSQETEQVLLIGYNNHAFDDHFLLHHCKRELDSEKFNMLLRENLFTSDLQNIAGKQKLTELLIKCNGRQDLVKSLHDALKDCEAMAHIINQMELTINNFLEKARSFELLHDRVTDPLLRAKLITPAVAGKLTEQMTCKRYLAMSEEEVRTFLRSQNVATSSLNVCLRKRRVYVEFLNQLDNLDDIRLYYYGQSS